MRPATRTPRGVTLVELVAVITIVAVLATVGARMIASTATGGQSSIQRLQLATAGDAALRRMARELQGALPNSVRLTTSGSSVLIEFIPVADAGRLRRSTDSSGNGDPLDYENAADSSFDVLGPPISFTGSVELVVQNLGNDVADAYKPNNNRRAGVVLTNAGSTVNFTPAGSFPDATSSARFFLVTTPVTFVCTPAADGTGTVTRMSGYGWNATQPTTFSTGNSAVLASDVTACSASYAESLANLGMVSIQLTLGQGDASARMLHQVAVDNTP